MNPVSQKKRARLARKGLNKPTRGVRDRAGRYELDVDMRSRRKNQLKARAAARYFVLGVAIVVAGWFALRAAYWGVFRMSHGNPEFALTEVITRTNGRLTRERILRELRIPEGLNVLKLDLPALKERLLTLPQVEAVHIARHMPDKVVIEVEERTPIAWLECLSLGIAAHSSSSGYLLDGTGVAMRCDTILSEYGRLPVVRAPRLEQVDSGRRINSRQFLQAIELLHLAPNRLGESGLRISKVNLAKEYAIIASFENECEVTFRPEELDRQLADVATLVRDARQRGRQIASLNLLPERNIPVTYFVSTHRPPDLTEEIGAGAGGENRIPKARMIREKSKTDLDVILRRS